MVRAARTTHMQDAHAHRQPQRRQSFFESLEPRRLFAVGTPIGFGQHATGGGSGPTVTVSNAADFAAYATQSAPVNIQIKGTINIGGVRLASNKTIFGLGADATLI